MDTLPRYFEFVRLPSFERTASGVLGEAEIGAMEEELLRDPRAGDVIRGTGGVRKVRVATQGRGKRGSARVIYLYVEIREKIDLLLVFPKNVQADLTPTQTRQVRELVEHLKEKG